MSSRAIINKGCKTTTGGEVLEGYKDVKIKGKEIAVEDMLVECPACKSTGKIVVKEKLHVFAHSKQVACEGDYVKCLCQFPTNILLADQHQVFANKPDAEAVQFLAAEGAIAYKDNFDSIKKLILPSN